MENEELKDFKITTDHEEFKAHKFVLAARSPTFASIFKKNVHAETLNLIDISTKVFSVVLDFIYTVNLPQTDEVDFIELLKVSERFKIEKLKKFSARKLINQVNSENALEILTLSNSFGYDELKQKAFEEIKKIFDTETIDDDLANKPEKLKKLIDFKIKKNQILAEMEENFKQILSS
ncbi:hypothetical protein PVAND_000903 [Polypedilum vanderplanki]|uniref:BTB domain-containing protein n=1 Tax=Polypedilum vanderplanki TaxID=319348 RepID=A0A9J6BLY1_POLVA|nr:hypothetical protein PVAND_000903 [Polypedilum vanderplanki]